MKKIINGKTYNTETAEKLGSYWNGYGKTDFNYYEEYLFRKKNGEFFLYGEGNAMSKYRKQCGDMLGSGEDITPLTEIEAKKWCENHLETNEYIEIFGEPEE